MLEKEFKGGQIVFKPVPISNKMYLYLLAVFTKM